MPARLDTAAAARSVISRAEQFVARWPGGYGRTLWQRVTIIEDDPADLALGLWFACAGCQVQVCSADDSPWVRDRDDALMPELARMIVGREPRLLTHPLDGLQFDNYHRRWGFTYDVATDDAALAEKLTGPTEVVLIDGLSRLSRDPAGLLRLIHERTQWSSSIEILPRDADANAAEVLEEVRRRAIAIGFGVRALPEGGVGGLSLVRLASPMSEHPVLDDPTIMAHCAARLDVAASLAKDRRVLDAGGWAGLGAERYFKAGASRIVNLDISEEALQMGRERLGEEQRVEFVQWDLNQAPLPFEDGEFDLVVCLETLEHIRQQRQAIGEFLRVLEPGGLLLVSVPDREFEETWERLNEHGNAFHLHVPSRDELQQWLGAFESIRWLRQADVSGSFVFEERSRSGPRGGRFSVYKPWSVTSAPAQVVMALCAKAGGKKSGAKRRAKALASDLHVYTSQSRQVAQVRSDEAASRERVRQERFEWWTRHNALEAHLEELRASLDAARSETQQWRTGSRTDERMDGLVARLDATHKSIVAITTELSAARSQHESESRRWLDQIHQQTNVLNEAQRQRYQASVELKESQQRVASQAAEIARLSGELAAAQQQAAAAQQQASEAHAQREAAQKQSQAERDQREKAHSELTAAVQRLAARLDDDRRTLLRRIESLLEVSRDEMDRRCLTVEGRVYDLEDELDRPAVSPHRNGSPSK